MQTIPLATYLFNEEVASEDKDHKTRKRSCWVQFCLQQREEKTNFLKIFTGEMHPQTKLQRFRKYWHFCSGYRKSILCKKFLD